MNVKGGPDRRFKNNPRLRIMLYGSIKFTIRIGLNMQWYCSRPASTRQLSHAISFYAAPPEVPWELDGVPHELLRCFATVTFGRVRGSCH
ncbi:hypothetical protein [Catenulispora pinisilvae]|uniref:hypothetical protein n=1 Tax=Catenulispora pinisilvae TaxID=2705253 RepID=UPI00189136D0|nr:hypothetical protein [Catenulispora pinisilvae]